MKRITLDGALKLAKSTLGQRVGEYNGYAASSRRAASAHPVGSETRAELETESLVYEENAATYSKAIEVIEDRLSLEAETAVLRQVLHVAVEEATVEGRHSNGAATFIGIGVKAFDRMQFALSATTAGQSLLDELQQLRQREAGLKSLLSVLVKEMETFRERNIDRTFDYEGALAAGVSMMGQWQRQIEAICGAPSTPTEGPKEVPHD